MPRDFGKTTQMFHLVWLRYMKIESWLKEVDRILTSVGPWFHQTSSNSKES